MRYIKRIASLILLAILVIMQQCQQRKNTGYEKEISEQRFYSIRDFALTRKFDSHVHLNTFNTCYIKLAEENNFRFLDIVDDRPFGLTMEELQKIAVKQSETFPETVGFATTFSVKDWTDSDWVQQTIAHLKGTLAYGAIAVKVWKNIGMSLNDGNGEFVMIDNPRFDPILDYLASNNIPVIGHLGEPKNCWMPVTEMTVKGDRNYYKEHPEYHMYLHPEYPSYDDQINARDHMLKKHPDLKFIGAHLGSLEWDLNELAKRLDNFPNMVVDLARMSHLHLHAKTNWQRTREFFIKYQNRLLYATDIQVRDWNDITEMKKEIQEKWVLDWKFFATDDAMSDPNVDGEFRGLKLPGNVIDKIYRKNALRWLFSSIKAERE